MNYSHETATNDMLKAIIPMLGKRSQVHSYIKTYDDKERFSYVVTKIRKYTKDTPVAVETAESDNSYTIIVKRILAEE
jgi:hypothetical protein